MGCADQFSALSSEQVLEKITPFLERIDNTAFAVTEKILSAFAAQKVSEAHLRGSTGYGYGDIGRDTLDKVMAAAMDAEDALVRPQIISGTHAISIALAGVLQHGDTLLSVTGTPYDTLLEVIGVRPAKGSLAEYGVTYRQVDLKGGAVDFEGIADAMDNSVKVVFVQKSKGYQNRVTLSSAQIGDISAFVKKINKNVIVVVDNCYGEFCQLREPTYYGADLMAGSLIKNPGGGIAKTGGYLAGNSALVEMCAARLTTPGIGRESGATMGFLGDFYQGLFIAPHVVAQALKTALFCAELFKRLGYYVNPLPSDERFDIIQAVRLGRADKLIAFCRGIQAASPIDSFVTPEPWDMPGYNEQVIMAAGTFVQGASIELSADAPLKPPYNVFVQGALSFESGRLGIMKAASAVLELEQEDT